MRAVNLLPRQDEQRKLGVDRALVAAVAVTVVVAAPSPAASSSRRRTPRTAQQRLAAAQAALARAQSQQPTDGSPAPAQLQIPVVLSQEEPWHVALDSALSTRVVVGRPAPAARVRRAATRSASPT